MVELGGRLGGSIVFLSVLLQQLGVPIPAEPTLIVAGSVGARHPLSLPGVVAFALLAVLAADSLWFVLGRRYGRRMLWLIYRLSRSPDRWMQRTESVYRRRGLKSVALIKFIPGLPMLAPLFAGTMKARYGPFLLYDLSAAAIWASLAVVSGALFRRQVGALQAALARASVPAAIALAIGIAGVILWRWWRRRTARDRDVIRAPPPVFDHPANEGRVSEWPSPVTPSDCSRSRDCCSRSSSSGPAGMP